MSHDIKKHLTRRQLLASGAYGFCGYLVAPGILSMLTDQVAFGACAATGTGAQANRKASFLVFDLAGGGNIAGNNVMVGREDDQRKALPVGAYRTLGLPDALHPGDTTRWVAEFGLLFHSQSAMLAGLMEVTTPATRANVDGIVFAAKSADDTENNPHNPVHWIARAGLVGDLVPLIGTQNSPSGGRSASPASSIDPANRPITIARPQDVGLIVDKGKLATLLKPNEAEAVLKAAQAMSAEKLKLFNEKTLSSQVKELVDCGYLQSVELLTKFSAEALNPANDQQVVNANTGAFKDFAANELARRTASVAKTVIEGYAGAGTIVLGGYDYHEAIKSDQEKKEREAGRLIGQALELARIKQQDLMIYVCSDGAVGANGQMDAATGKYRFSGDSGDRGAAFILVYKKDGKPTVLKDGRQIGSYKDNGAVQTDSSLISGEVENLAKAVVLNYMALNGTERDFAKVVGADPFGTNLDRYKLFGKLRG